MYDFIIVICQPNVHNGIYIYNENIFQLYTIINAPDKWANTCKEQLWNSYNTWFIQKKTEYIDVYLQGNYD